VISDERRKIVDDARLTLGFIYYELSYADIAFKYFKDVAKSHPNYADALLGQGWSKVKLNLFEDALDPLKIIITDFPNTAHAEEAYFLIGQCFMKLNRYDEAIKIYDKIIELFPKQIDFSQYMKQISLDLERKSKVIEQLETDLLIQESQLLEALPVDGTGKHPAYLEDERQKIQNYRDTLVKQIIEERNSLKAMREIIEKLREKNIRQYQRKDWRGYAEYGRARSLYLKEMSK
jgi:tetratricopeptide (TPR) repeat protein